MLIRLFQEFDFGFGMDMLEGFGMVKFFLGILKGGGELGKKLLVRCWIAEVSKCWSWGQGKRGSKA